MKLCGMIMCGGPCVSSVQWMGLSFEKVTLWISEMFSSSWVWGQIFCGKSEFSRRVWRMATQGDLRKWFMKQPQKKEAGTTTPLPAATAVMCLNLLPKFLGFEMFEASQW